MLLMLSYLLAFAWPASAADLVGRASVVDGDTIELHGTRIRLYRIDAPESARLCRDSQGMEYCCG